MIISLNEKGSKLYDMAIEIKQLASSMIQKTNIEEENNLELEEKWKNN